MEKPLEKFQEALVERYGELLNGQKLCKVIGYPSLAALKLAHRKGLLTLRVFKVPGRPGLSALTVDVAQWLYELSTRAEDKSQKEGPEMT